MNHLKIIIQRLSSLFNLVNPAYMVNQKRKIPESDYSFVMSVRPSVRMQQLDFPQDGLS